MLKFIAKLLIASLFVISSLKIIFYGFNDFVGMIQSKNLPFPEILAIIVLTLKIVAGLALIISTNKFIEKVSAGSLALFTLLTIILYHNAFTDPTQFNGMLKNMAVLGGLLLIL